MPGGQEYRESLADQPPLVGEAQALRSRHGAQGFGDLRMQDPTFQVTPRAGPSSNHRLCRSNRSDGIVIRLPGLDGLGDVLSTAARRVSQRPERKASQRAEPVVPGDAIAEPADLHPATPPRSARPSRSPRTPVSLLVLGAAPTGSIEEPDRTAGPAVSMKERFSGDAMWRGSR